MPDGSTFSGTYFAADGGCCAHDDDAGVRDEGGHRHDGDEDEACSGGRGCSASLAGRLAMLPGYAQHKPPKIEQVQPHILPALSAALASFGKLRCHAEVAGLLYMRARIWHSVGSHELRDRDARAFVLSEQYAAEAASRTCGSLLDFAETGVLEMHIERLKVLQADEGGRRGPPLQGDVYTSAI